MPDLIDILEIAEALESKAVFVASDRCVVARNRNVKCRKCVQACSQEAIAIEGNKIELDNKVCVACGACTTACPTEALVPLRPLDAELALAAADACIEADKRAIFACARVASKRMADPIFYAEVPCLARIEESLLLELIAQGVKSITLIDGGCESCKFRHCSAAIEGIVGSVNTLVESMGSEFRVERALEFPDDMLLESKAELLGESRRGFFSKQRENAKDAAEKTVLTMISKGESQKTETLREKLGISAGGTLPQFGADRRLHMLDALDSIGSPQVPQVKTRLWGKVKIDTDRCNTCNMCTVFCPTGALAKVEVEEEDAETGKKKTRIFVEFSMAECVQCRTCEDICLQKCLTLDSCISLDELFDFEPAITELPEAPQKKGFLSALKRSR